MRDGVKDWFDCAAFGCESPGEWRCPECMRWFCGEHLGHDCESPSVDDELYVW